MTDMLIKCDPLGLLCATALKYDQHGSVIVIKWLQTAEKVVVKMPWRHEASTESRSIDEKTISDMVWSDSGALLLMVCA